MIYTLLFILLFAIELIYFRIANKYDIIDKPNERSSHAVITIRGGGIIFWVGALLFFLVSKFQYPLFFLGISLITAISFADDIKSRSPFLRLILQFIAVALMFLQISNMEGSWVFAVLSFVIAVGILNAFNFMDGINGMTGAYSLAVIASMWYINNYIEPFVENQFLYLIMLSLVVFGFFNFRVKARCFAGDTGSISIAFIILFLLGMLIYKTKEVSYVALLMVYGVDTVLTIIHRMILKENITQPHRKHLFQLLSNEMKIPQLTVSAIYALIQLLIVAGLIACNAHAWLYCFVVAVFLSAGYIILINRYFHLHKL